MAERERDPAKVTLHDVRLSFPSLWKAKPFGKGGRKTDDQSEPKFQANFLLDPEDPKGKRNIQKVQAAIDYVIKQKWPKDAPRLREDKLPLRRGEDGTYEGYNDNMMFVSSGNAKKPRVLDIDNNDVLEGDDGAPYAGCFVTAVIRIWAQDNDWGKRVNASLEGVRFFRDGDAFGAAPIDERDFDDDDDDDRGSRRSRSRDEDEDRPRRSRDDDRGDRRDRAEDDRDSRRGRDRDEADDRQRSRRDDRDDRDERRGRDDDRGRDRDDDRGGRRSRDEDEDRPRERRSRDDDDRGRSRSRRDEDVV